MEHCEVFAQTCETWNTEVFVQTCETLNTVKCYYKQMAYLTCYYLLVTRAVLISLGLVPIEQFR